MNRLGPVLVALFTALPAFAQDVSEPKSGIRFAEKDGNMSLLGVGLRKKAIMKVYAIGLYVADSTLSGALKGKAGTPELYREIASGDFKKKVVTFTLSDGSLLVGSLSNVPPDPNRRTTTYDIVGRPTTTVDPRGNAPGANPADHRSVVG